jgi:hypothetical protein
MFQVRILAIVEMIGLSELLRHIPFIEPVLNFMDSRPVAQLVRALP